jgi:hypothetical protein
VIGEMRRPELLRAARRACCLLVLSGCASVTPQAVSPDIAQPVFEPGAVLRGPFALGPALCSLATVGLDVTLLPAEPGGPEETQIPALSTVCSAKVDEDHELSTGPRGLWARLGGEVAWAGDPQQLEARRTGISALVYRVREPRGIAVLFTGLAMPADSDALRRFAVALARRRWLTAVVVRDESIGGFDPRWEAHRGLALASALRGSCAGGGAPVAFLGLSMGGLEALLAARDAPVRPALGQPRAVVLDPVLDLREVAAHLDSTFHSVSTDAMQTFFQRIMAGRYRRAPVRFTCEIERRPPTGRMTDPDADAPAAWLCDGPVRRYSIFLSATDPVLGDEQRRRLEARAFSFERTEVGGHVPLACDLALYDRMADATTDTTGATFSVCAGPTEQRPSRLPDPSCGITPGAKADPAPAAR